MDDVRAGRYLRGLRKRLNWTQRQLAERCGMSQQQVSLLERGHLAGTQVRVVRAAFAALDASAGWEIRWRGGALDRLLDDRHAALVAALSDLLTGVGWQVLPEVTYSVFGERGSIDLVAWHAPTATLLIVEVKTELTSVEATLRKHDEKARLGPGVVRERFGWRPAVVARLLVLPDLRTPRRQVARADRLLARVYPVRGWAVRQWLRHPAASEQGFLMFLSPTNGSSRSHASSRDPGPKHPPEG